MFIKYALITVLLAFTYAFTQNQLPKKDTVTTYKRSLSDCKTWEDSIRHYMANIQIDIKLIELRNDSMKQRNIRDSITAIDTSKIKIP